MTDEEKRQQIAYLQHGLEELKGNIPDRQWYEYKTIIDKEIRELGGESYGKRED